MATTTKATHTPGPWHVWQQGEPDNKGSLSIYDADDTLVARVDWFGLRDLKTNIMHDEEAQANARLIAAAPELLEACKSLLCRVVDDENARRKQGIITLTIMDLIEQAESAILAATGGAQ